MLQKTKDVTKCMLNASDGRIGKIQDIAFDDERWSVRYLVVDTGNWLDRRSVLISPVAIEAPAWSQQSNESVLFVGLTKEQVRLSPIVESDEPVSRQHEIELSRHYGWPAYWENVSNAGIPATDLPSVDVPRATGNPPGSWIAESPVPGGPPATSASRDSHLHSIREIVGLNIAANDGSIGHVTELLLEDRDWTLRYLIVDTRNWWPGKHVMFPIERIRRVDWSGTGVVVEADRDTLKGAPEYDPARIMRSDDLRQLHDYFNDVPEPSGERQRQ
jgi:hypothetical protein